LLIIRIYTALAFITPIFVIVVAQISPNE